MSEQPKVKRCTSINHKNVMPGWGCCICRTYNGEHRPECKHCGHKRCDENEANKSS